jgi:uncharacterized protein (DUF488 family)
VTDGDERDSRVEATVWTIGHSTRSSDELIGVLAHYGIECVADVRRFPGSRRLPQFESGALERSLAAHGMAYQWIPALGGRRTPDARSLNVGWRHAAFRAYADHMASEEFAVGLVDLLTTAYGVRTAIMCAEILWWRCHRRLIADVLTVIGAEVIHIRDDTHSDIHRLQAPAAVVREQLSYP